MISSFDLTKLHSLLQDFYNMTKMRITVFDDAFHELAAYPEQRAPFCQIIRSDDTSAAACHRCDMQACEIAASRRTLYTYRCHAGLTESITPIIVGNIIIGYLLFGHVFSYPSYEEGWEQIQKCCKDYSIDMNALKTACYKQPVITEDYISSASHIMQAVASYLCMERMVSLRRQELPVQIDAYIQEHFTEKINAAQLARHFGIGKTQLYEIAKQSYGIGIAEQIRNLRIEKAKQLLSECPDLSLAQIAFECGFSDYNYFITVFKRTVGVPPKVYANTVLQSQ
ncbi:MAG: PocR ligand-binding domain-containing protein [Lachnospiraceae bacterium]|nr:PocR ligand-binding domain-containing protein [Lachnospiraceae bacterium]